MNDISSLFGSSFFFPGKNPNVPADLRQRLALAMMAQKRAYPKTFGEGLASIGDSIGDRAMMSRIEREAADAELAGRASENRILGTSTPASAAPGYAPPDNGAPAVDAINRAITPPPPPPPSMVPPPPGAPAGGAAPVAAGPGGMVEPEAFNEIDAADPRNRFKPPPAYLAPALERNIADPERRGYLGQLAGKEARSASEVSPTGAAGPFQFTRGTGAQYGIPGAARFDPDASTQAVNRFTDDNVRALTAKLGREPTPGEMALAHQQGAGTAGNMLSGTGNAPPRNLAVNNVPPGMGPQAAAQKIMGYYGMPGAGGVPPVPADPRDGAALALMDQGSPAAPPAPGRPSVADYGQKLALAPTPPPPQPQQAAIPAAPPATPPIQKAPQLAQAGPAADYVPPEKPAPRPPPLTTDVMQRIQEEVRAASPADRDAVQKRLAPLYQAEQGKLAQAHEVFKDEQIAHRAYELERQKALQTAAQRGQTYTKDQEAITEARSKNALRQQFGNMDPETVFKTMTESSKVAGSAAKSLAASQSAIQALNAGAITGSGAEARLDIKKFLNNMGLPDKGNTVANTETFRGAMQPVVASIMHQTSGTSQLSEGELKFAANAAAGNITLDAQSIRQLTTIIDKASRGIIADHQKKLDVLFPENEKAKALFGVEAPKTKEDDAREWLAKHPDDPRAGAVRQRLGIP
jgi:hypothetical protein